MFDFFKVLFSSKPKNEIDKQEEAIENDVDDIRIKMREEVLRMLNEEREKTQISQKPPAISKNNDIITKTKRNNMPEVFLVTLDTTNRTEAKSFSKNLQNFYFVWATDETNAKELVLFTFKNPVVKNQLFSCIKATQLNRIIGGMGNKGNFWSYIPMGNQRFPGQQALIPDPEKLTAKVNIEGELVNRAKAYVPPAIDASGFDDTPKAKQQPPAAAAGGFDINAMKAAFPNADPAQLQMMAMMATMMAGSKPAPLVEEAPPVLPSVTDRDIDNMLDRIEQ